jgi:hypothetical protein
MILKGDLAKLESENDLLKNELKRLSKLTTEKILGGYNKIWKTISMGLEC